MDKPTHRKYEPMELTFSILEFAFPKPRILPKISVFDSNASLLCCFAVQIQHQHSKLSDSAKSQNDSYCCLNHNLSEVFGHLQWKV